jgi:hypothetical protein
MPRRWTFQHPISTSAPKWNSDGPARQPQERMPMQFLLQHSLFWLHGQPGLVSEQFAGGLATRLQGLSKPPTA